jgi:hypothetical protein
MTTTMTPRPGLLLLLLVCLGFLVCSTWAAPPPNDQQPTREAVQRALLEQGPLAPFAPRRRSSAASVDELDSLVREFTSVPPPLPSLFIVAPKD